MKKAIFLLLGLLSPATAWGQSSALKGQMVVPFDRSFVDLSINGHPIRLKVDLGASSGVILNPRAAVRAGLVKSGSVVMSIGPVKLRGSRTNAIFTLGDAQWSAKTSWYDRDYVGDADGVISAHDLPFARVTLRGPRSGSQSSFALPASYNDDRGLHHPVRIAGRKVAVRFSFLRHSSVATGSAGALLAKQQGGRLEGTAVQQHIGWGIHRPTRRLMLGQPWVLGGFTIPDMLVRLRDFRGKSKLPSHQAESMSADVTVVGRIGPHQDAENFLTIGLDHLSSCQSIDYDRIAKTIEFRC